MAKFTHILKSLMALALSGLGIIFVMYTFNIKREYFNSVGRFVDSSLSHSKPEKLKMPLYVAAILVKDDSYFLIQRKNTDWAQGYWNFPGGLVEPNETILQAVIRETKEEVGVVVNPEDFEQVHILHVRKSETNTQDIVGIYFKATKWNGTPHNAEPHKMSGAQWFCMQALPNKITEHAQLIIKGLQSGQRYSESGW